MASRLSPYLRYLWRVTDGYHAAALLLTGLGVIRVGAVLAAIWLMKTAIDCATGRISAADYSLIGLFALMVACLLADVAISQVIKYKERRAVLKMNNRLNRRLFGVLMNMPLVNGQQGFHSGDMLNRLTLDVRTVSEFALSELPSMVVMMVQLVGAFIFLACLSPVLALAPVVIMPICILAGNLYIRRQRRLTAQVRELESNIHVAIQEGLRHRLVLRSLECFDEVDRRLCSLQQNLDLTGRGQARLSTISSAMVRFGFIVGYLTAFGWSLFSLAAGVISYGTMTAFIQLVNRIQHPIAGLANYIPLFVSTSVALDRLHEIDGYSSTPKRNESIKELIPSAGLRVSNLSYRYDSDSENVLTDFSYDFKPGSRTMIVGSTGAGKTTLIKLLLGMLKPDSGTITIYTESGTPSTGSGAPSTGSGAPPPHNYIESGSYSTGSGAPSPHKCIESGSPSTGSGAPSPHKCTENGSPHKEDEVTVSAATLSNFVYVPQGNSLLPGTIRENLLLAAPQATDHELADALHTAAADFVFDLPQGLDTACDEAGGGLSEGQAQRIAIARALLRPGSILLLDEFNSALDTSTATTLMQRLIESHPNSTIIIIAHHQTVIAPYCDAILRIS